MKEDSRIFKIRSRIFEVFGHPGHWSVQREESRWDKKGLGGMQKHNLT